MKPVNKSTLSARVVTEPAAINRLRWFQTERYLDAGLVSHISATLPEDPFVAASTYFGVYDGDQVAATARVVCVDDMPMLTYHSLAPDFQDRLAASRGSTAEISRLAVDRSTPNFVALALLSREFLHFGLNNPQASLLVASVERPLVRMLDQLLGVPLHIMGDEIPGYGHYEGACVPILIDTAECLRAFKAQKSRYWQFFIEDLVIDLRLDSTKPSLTL